ncbi:MAG: helix-turn-helix transcriptional regulator [Bacteroidetes bacterium]|nr:helix-turn-helix transcriptional regulator [Bacteroidota bacterium]
MPFDIDIYKRVVNAKMYIDDNLHEPIGLEQVSEKACFSPFHFHRLFTCIYRKTPHEYLTQVRIEAAKQMLRKGNDSVTHVCASVGFESLGSFSTLFKKKNGVSPQEYRVQQQERQKAVTEQPLKFIPHCLASHFGAE